MVDSGRRATQPKTAQKLMGLKNYRDLRVKHRQNLLSFNDKSKIIWGAWAPLLTPDPPKIVPTITTSVAPPPKIITAKNTTPWPPVIIGLPACKYFLIHFFYFESEIISDNGLKHEKKISNVCLGGCTITSKTKINVF